MKHIYPIKSGMLRNVGTQIDGKDGNDKKSLDNSIVVTRVISAKLGGRFDFSKKNYGRSRHRHEYQRCVTKCRTYVGGNTYGIPLG